MRGVGARRSAAASRRAVVLMAVPLLLEVGEEARALVHVDAQGIVVPMANHEETDEHTSEVGEVGHAVARRADGREELHDHIEQHEPLGLDGEGNGEDEEPVVGERHTEGQQHGIDGTRGAHRGPLVEDGRGVVGHNRHHAQVEIRNLVLGDEIELGQLGKLLADAGADTAAYIIEEELAASPNVLHHTAEHPKREHIKEYVLEVGMHEHVGKELIEVEIVGQEEMQSEHVASGNDGKQQKNHDIGYQQVFSNRC